MSLSAGEEIKIPCPIDIHAHLREPGGTGQETIASGTYAALRGGYQAVCDMPNNPGGQQTWTADRLADKYARAERSARSDIGFYAGVDLAGPDLAELGRMVGRAAGLKLYLGRTTGNTEEFGLDQAREPIDEWIRRARERGRPYPPILLHAREAVGAEVAEYIARSDYPVHWCHIATPGEIASCRMLRTRYGPNFTAGVTPHHLTMTARDADFKYGWPAGRMMPPLGSETDAGALLAAFNMADLQILETDHAPHTEADKLAAEADNPTGETEAGCTACYGVSGIEFILPVMISLVVRRRIALDRLVDALRYQPARLLGLEDKGRSTTTIAIGPYVLDQNDRIGRSQNHPYAGWVAWGRIDQVAPRGQIGYDRGGQARTWPARVIRPGSSV